MSLWATCLAHTNMIMHSFGWMEGGLRASFEKLIIDLEIVQTLMKVMERVDFSDSELGLDAMREVGSGGHYFVAQPRWNDTTMRIISRCSRTGAIGRPGSKTEW